MKRKHDVLVDDQNRVDSAAAQSSFAQSNTGQYLQGQDLLTESVFLLGVSALRRQREAFLYQGRVWHVG